MAMGENFKFIFAILLAILFQAQARSFFRRNDYSIYDEDQQNSLSPIGRSSMKNPSHLMRNFVKITSSTKDVLSVRRGDPIELECIVVGSYGPSLDWYKGNVPVTHGEDNNYITKFGVTTAVVRYLEECAQPKHEGTYTCRAVSGNTEVTSPPVTVLVSDKLSTKLLNNGEQCPNKRLPKITRYYQILIQSIGTDGKLLCKTRGYPRPHVYWTDKNGNVLDTSAGSRYKLLESGDLIIRNLRWPDMGNYFCVAQNMLGKDSISTFLYPMLDEKSETEE